MNGNLNRTNVIFVIFSAGTFPMACGFVRQTILMHLFTAQEELTLTYTPDLTAQF